MSKTLVLKFGFRFFWGKALRIMLSLVLIVVSLTVSSVGLIVSTFDYSEIMRQIYYSDTFHESVIYRPDKYMNFLVRATGYVEPDNLRAPSLNEEETHALEEQMQKIGQGYFVTKFPTSASSWDVGPYRLFEYFDVEGFDPDVYNDEIREKHRLYDEKGQFAPYFTYSQDPKSMVGGGELSENELKYYTEAATCEAVRAFYQGIAVYEGDVEDLELYGYTLHGRLPEGLNEIVIPQSIYNSFSAYGYIDHATGERADIHSYEDIIGREIEMYQSGKAEIVGVLEVDYKLEELWMMIFMVGNIETGTVYQWGVELGAGPIFNNLVSEEYLETYQPQHFKESEYWVESDPLVASHVTVLKWSEPAIRDAYWEIAAEGERKLDPMKEFVAEEPYLSYSFGARGDTNFMEQIAFRMREFLPFTWTAYLSIPFTLLLTVYLVYATLYEKRRRLYILRCLGMSRRRTALMLAVPVLAFALLAGALALIGTAAVLPQMFSALEITVFETRFMIDIAGFTLTPLSCAYLILWPLLSGAAGVGLSMLSYNSVLRRAGKGGEKK